MRRYSVEGLSTRVYGGEAERRSRDAWGKRVSSATRAGHRCWCLNPLGLGLCLLLSLSLKPHGA